MMHSPSHGTVSLDLTQGRGWRFWGGVTAIQIVFALLALEYGWLWALAPVAALVTATALVWPRAGVFMLATLLYFRYPLPGLIGIYPADAMAFLVIAGTIFQRLLRGERIIERTWANRWLALILITFAISLTAAFDLAWGFKNWLRHVQLIGLMVAIASCVERRDIFTLIRWMVVLTVIVSLGNILTYVVVGGEKRTFGPAGPFFATFTVLAALRAAVGLLMSPRRRFSAGWGILLVISGMGLLVTQTRAAMLQLVLTLGLLFVVVWFLGRKSGRRFLQWRSFLFGSLMALVGVVILSDLIPLLHSPSARISAALQGHAATVDYRLFLWKTGLHAFIDAPVFGIGLGQISKWDQFLTYWRFDVTSMFTRGLGAHNSSITYLAETGVVGSIPLLWFLWRMFATGARALKRVRSHAQATETLIVWIPVAAMTLGYFFRTHMFYSLDGMLTSFYFAFWIKYSTLMDNERVGTETAAADLAV